MIKRMTILTLLIGLIFTCKVQVTEVESAEFVYLTKCVQAEAGNQDFKGKRLVAAVILNRVDDPRFPNTITEVINAPKQFAVVHNKSIEKVTIDQETIDACMIELTERSDKDIIYFNNSSKVGGRFCFKHGKHWFGK